MLSCPFENEFAELHHLRRAALRCAVAACYRARVTQQQKVTCGVLGFMALFALYGTWSQNLAYGTGPDAFGKFILDSKVTPAGRSLGVDIAVTFYAASVLMVFEARKLGVRFVWAYVLLGLLIAISVTFPLFLIAREMKLAKGAATEPLAGKGLQMPDIVGLGVLAVITVGLSLYVIS